MRRLLRWLRDALYRASGVDPEPVIVTLMLGPEDACEEMRLRMRELLPGYRHVTVRAESAATAGRALARALRGKRTAMIAAAPPGWRAALWRAPFRTMAFNSRGENWFIKWSDPISSILFLRGLTLDRIVLRPAFWPGARERTEAPDAIGVIEGRPASPLRAPFAVLTPYLPWPLAHGGAVRIHALLREAARDFDVDLYAFVEAGGMPDVGPLAQLCRRIVYVGKPRYREPRWASLDPPEVREYESPAMRRALQGVHPLQVEYTQLAAYGGEILVEHDVTFDLYAQIHAHKKSLASWWDWYRWRRFERRAVRRARPVVMSAKDAAMLAMPNARVIANGVDLERFQPVPERSGRRLLFVGSFRHFPNVSAFQWFWRQVWPRLRGCRLTVVAGPEPLLYWRTYTGERHLPTADGLDLRGFVADVKPLYDDCNVVVTPTLVSAGTNLKVLEAMAMRRAVVSTPSGIAGIGLRDGEDVLVAETPEAFADAIERLLRDDALRTRVAVQANGLAHARYSWKSLGALQTELWHEFSPAPLRIVSEPSPARAFGGYPAYVARLRGDVVAHLTWREITAGERELLLVETETPHRRQGIARRLLEHALSAAPARWFLEVRVSNTGARELYLRAGFRETGLRKGYYSDPKEDALLMEWSR